MIDPDAIPSPEMLRKAGEIAKAHKVVNGGISPDAVAQELWLYFRSSPADVLYEAAYAAYLAHRWGSRDGNYQP